MNDNSGYFDISFSALPHEDKVEFCRLYCERHSRESLDRVRWDRHWKSNTHRYALEEHFIPFVRGKFTPHGCSMNLEDSTTVDQASSSYDPFISGPMAYIALLFNLEGRGISVEQRKVFHRLFLLLLSDFGRNGGGIPESFAEFNDQIDMLAGCCFSHKAYRQEVLAPPPSFGNPNPADEGNVGDRMAYARNLQPGEVPSVKTWSYLSLEEIVRVSFRSSFISNRLRFVSSSPRGTLRDIMDGTKFRSSRFFGPKFYVMPQDVLREETYIYEGDVVRIGTELKRIVRFREEDGELCAETCSIGNQHPPSLPLMTYNCGLIDELVIPNTSLPYRRGTKHFALGFVLFSDEFGKTKRSKWDPMESVQVALINLDKSIRFKRECVFTVAVANRVNFYELLEPILSAESLQALTQGILTFSAAHSQDVFVQAAPFMICGDNQRMAQLCNMMSPSNAKSWCRVCNSRRPEESNRETLSPNATAEIDATRFIQLSRSLLFLSHNNVVFPEDNTGDPSTHDEFEPRSYQNISGSLEEEESLYMAMIQESHQTLPDPDNMMESPHPSQEGDDQAANTLEQDLLSAFRGIFPAYRQRRRRANSQVQRLTSATRNALRNQRVRTAAANFRSKHRENEKDGLKRVHNLNFNLIPEFDPCKDCALDLLHFLPLGLIKHVWNKAFTDLFTPEDKRVLGLLWDSRYEGGVGRGKMRVRGNPFAYPRSFQGREFRNVARCASTVLYQSRRQSAFTAIWHCLSLLSKQAYQSSFELDDLPHLQHLFDQVIYATTEQSLFGNLKRVFKCHLTRHFSFFVERFGPPVSYSAETFESNHKVYRGKIEMSNRQNINRDILVDVESEMSSRLFRQGGLFMTPSAESGLRWIGPSIQTLPFAAINEDFERNRTPVGVVFRGLLSSRAKSLGGLFHRLRSLRSLSPEQRASLGSEGYLAYTKIVGIPRIEGDHAFLRYSSAQEDSAGAVIRFVCKLRGSRSGCEHVIGNICSIVPPSSDAIDGGVPLTRLEVTEGLMVLSGPHHAFTKVNLQHDCPIAGCNFSQTNVQDNAPPRLEHSASPFYFINDCS
jgi:hypothetical protein